ncbi:unnamed protein product, partial [marine sediment metagenome]
HMLLFKEGSGEETVERRDKFSKVENLISIFIYLKLLSLNYIRGGIRA